MARMTRQFEFRFAIALFVVAAIALPTCVPCSNAQAVPNTMRREAAAGFTNNTHEAALLNVPAIPIDPATDGTAPANDPRNKYVRLALKRFQTRHPELRVPPDMVQIVLDNQRLATAREFPRQAVKQMDQAFMYTLFDESQYVLPTFLNVKGQVWHVLMANYSRDYQVEPVVCVLAAGIEHEILGHMIRGDRGELAPTELEIAALRDCAKGGLANHPSITERLSRLEWYLAKLRGNPMLAASKSR